RPALGTGRRPETRDIGRAVTLSRHVELALVSVLATVGILRAVRRAAPQPGASRRSAAGPDAGRADAGRCR
ncbi:MAG: hypothetical protein ABSG81_12930, partial [Acidimicrobiales bacterium]